MWEQLDMRITEKMTMHPWCVAIISSEASAGRLSFVGLE